MSAWFQNEDSTFAAGLIDVLVHLCSMSIDVHLRLVTISRFGARQQHSRGHLAGPSITAAVAGRWDTLLTWPSNTGTPAT
jgi:hypothetical protein